MRKRIVAGNWKMNGSTSFVTGLLMELLQLFEHLEPKCECVVMPPAIFLPMVQNLLQERGIQWGAQNVYPAESGAYTGEHSGSMLNNYNCTYVLTGHSERRKLFGEDEKFVADKYHHVKEHGMIPILCVGETWQERQQDQTGEILARQILAVAERDRQCFRGGVIAYEPVWAIGTGQTATPEQAQETHAFIRQLIRKFDPDVADSVSLLYGGSVNEMNAESLFSMPDVDGGLVGGASLNAKQFVEIVKCIN
ncbi:triose-phosphate isomerase [Legionella spiritensis]|uniref:Triosephosphate isomerase n=1 Tax=Legionella spiritensis TaxID=452 RepID=A0A0W0Z6J5_LEGSP|nr:triose-phosphate isomerase [Legionella spiritensis]KTD64733.1 triosephosphate isomerase [Legionella spiritensis]SNV48098.1 triosephosphate isomerase [Legionella spiritensis]VEG91413.1 triosephosphate isomerase [Legionella spiritensis]